jgi:D-3-phosphoglycerate dehydrogenase
MSDTVEALIADLLEYLAGHERTYADVIDAWHTSCPKLPVWEEANERGLVTRTRTNGHAVVQITEAGTAFLARHRGSLH